MRIDISRAEGRLGLVGLVVFGLAHVLAPRLLLRVARGVYGRTLDIEFVARRGAPWRVRLVGLGSLVAAACGWRLLDRIEDLSIGTTSGEGPTPAPAHRSADDH